MMTDTMVYRPPRGKGGIGLALVGGVLVTVLIFLAVPLSQLIDMVTRPAMEGPAKTYVAPPPTPPPPPPPPEDEEIEEEPPPPELSETQPPLDFSLDIPFEGGFGGLEGIKLDDLPINLPADAIGDILDASQLDEAPRAVKMTPPRFPAALKRAKKEGRVVVLITLDETGKVVAAEIKSSTEPGFNQAALEAVKKWRFKPGQKNGHPISAKVVQPFDFSVKQ